VEGTFSELTVADTEVGYPIKAISTVQNSGNVHIVPQFAMRIMASPTVVASGNFAELAVYPNETKQFVTELDSSRLTPGEYVASVSVSLGGNDLGTRESRFKLLERGTLTRQGVLDHLLLMNGPVAPGTVAKVNAIFRNTGQIDSKAVFVGEFYRNGSLIKAIQGLERSVARGDQSTLEIFLDVPESGTYKLVGKVNFEGKETEAKELTFTVGSASPFILWGVAAAAVAVTGGAALVMLRRRSRQGRLRGGGEA
jgi:hypothetical protein